MTWTRIDDQFDLHPKVVAAGPLAELLHIHGLIYCNRYLTNGHVPAEAVGRLLDTDAINDNLIIHVSSDQLVARLVELGIWEKNGTGYEIHDFLRYQDSKAKVLKRRRSTTQRVRQWRDQKRGVKQKRNGNGTRT